jgi:hypothetical protein
MLLTVIWLPLVMHLMLLLMHEGKTHGNKPK